jgi:anthranilate/para-aminobenzoate synthase component II
LIDNYDSFTYNLVQAFLVLGADVDVRRNDAITVEQRKVLNPTHLCISPGPGHARTTPASAWT